MPDLPTIWFILVGVLLLGYAVLDGFDLGVGILHFVVGRSPADRRALMRTIGPVWDGNEVWLLTMGGALFAAFPLVYATVFSGFYLALMLLLLALIGRAVALEFRGHVDDPRWQRTWDVVFSAGSGLAALLLGVAVGNVAAGLPFSAGGDYEGGLLGLLNPMGLLTGVVSLALFSTHGAIWLTIRTDGALRQRARRVASIGWLLVAAGWLALTALAWFGEPHLRTNFDGPLPWLAPISVAIGVVALAVTTARGAGTPAFIASSLAMVGLVATLGISLYPSLVPDATGGEGLTVGNAASSEMSLGVMLVIALIGMPMVLAYTAWIYRRFWGPEPADREPEAGY
jgi:cytochrome d ubiquinol oxidase subunit II